jgi:hypothetical protein
MGIVTRVMMVMGFMVLSLLGSRCQWMTVPPPAQLHTARPHESITQAPAGSTSQVGEHVLHDFTALSQTWPGEHEPQVIVPPQLSPYVPHVAPSEAHVRQPPPPPPLPLGLHCFTLLSQTCPGAHVPQLTEPPQPSEIDPQPAPALAHVRGVQTAQVFVPLSQT